MTSLTTSLSSRQDQYSIYINNDKEKEHKHERARQHQQRGITSYATRQGKETSFHSQSIPPQFGLLPISIHSKICKFLDKNSQNYRMVCTYLFSIVKKVESFDSSIERFQAFIHENGEALERYSSKSRSIPPQFGRLRIDIHSKICEFLDKNSKNYRMVCRYLFKIVKEVECRDPRFARFQAFIHENYEVVGGYPSKIDTKRFFNYSLSLLFLTENPAELTHRFLNAAFLNRILSEEIKGIQLFGDGSKSSIDLWKKEKSGLFQYLNPHITDAVQSWDVLETETVINTIYEQYYLHLRRFIQTTQNFFHLYSKQLDLVQYEAFLFVTFSNESLKEILNPLKACREECSEEKFRALTKLTILLQIIKISKIPDSLMKTLNIATEYRDKALSLAIIKAWKKGNRVIVNAGKAHVKTFSDNFYAFFPGKQGSIPYLCLKPRDTITLSSIKQSLFRIFNQEVEPTPLASGKKPKTPATALKESLSLDLDKQIQTLLSLDCSRLDLHKNHAAAWHLFTTTIVEKELERLFREIETDL